MTEAGLASSHSEDPAQVTLQGAFAQLESQRRRALLAFWLGLLKTLCLAPLVFLPLALMVVAGGGVSLDVDSLPSWQQRLLELVAQLLERHDSVMVPGAFGWLLLGLAALFVYFRRTAREPGWNYIADYKRKVFSDLCERYFPGLAYDPSARIGYDAFEQTRLFAHSPEHYLSEDGFSGRIGSTDVRFCEVHAQRERRRFSDGQLRTYLDTYFRGLVFVADFHKHFHSTTRIVPRGEKTPKVRGEAAVEFENPVFNESFSTLSSDQVDVRYVLTTNMLEHILALQHRFKKPRALFRDEELWLLLPTTRDLFEPSLYRRADSTAQVRQFVADVRCVLDLVEALNLNTRIWTKD